MGIDTKKIESTRLDEEAHKKLKKFQGASYNKKIEDEKNVCAGYKLQIHSGGHGWVPGVSE